MPALADALLAAEPTSDADQRTWRSPEDRQSAARATYLFARRRGETLTGSQLASRYGMSERWGRARIAEVRDEATADGNRAALSRRGGTIAGTLSPRSDGTRGNDTDGSLPAALPGAGNGRMALPHGLPPAGRNRQMPAARQEVAVRTAEVDSLDGGGAAVAPSDKISSAPGSPSATQRRVTTIAVVVVATVAAAASYDHQRALAELAGEGWRSWLLPLSVDGLLTAATMLMLTRRRSGEPAGSLTWISLGLGVAASVAANVVGADPTLADPVLVGRLVAAWPPLALFLSLELLMRQLGFARSLASEGVRGVAGPEDPQSR